LTQKLVYFIVAVVIAGISGVIGYFSSEVMNARTISSSSDISVNSDIITEFDFEISQDVIYSTETNSFIYVVNTNLDSNYIAKNCQNNSCEMFISQVLERLSQSTFDSIDSGEMPADQEISITGYIIQIDNFDEYGNLGGDESLRGSFQAKFINGNIEVTSYKLGENYFEVNLEVEVALNSSDLLLTDDIVTQVYIIEGEERRIYLDTLAPNSNRDEFFYTVAASENVSFSLKRFHVDIEGLIDRSLSGFIQFDVKNWDGQLVRSGKLVIKAVDTLELERRKDISVLVVGHSLAGGQWPVYLYDQLNALPSNINVEFQGSLSWYLDDLPSGLKTNFDKSEIRREAGGGYSVWNLLNMSVNHYDERWPSDSPFLYQKSDGKFSLDIDKYRSEAFVSQAPDVIVLNVGENDLWFADLENQTVIDDIRKNIKTLIEWMRELSPDGLIIYALTNNYNLSDRAWEHNYQGQADRLDQLRRRVIFREMIIEITNEFDGVVTAPTDFYVDPIEGLPVKSGTHLNDTGAKQFADGVFGTLLANVGMLK